jgi:hypothetical protein
MNAIRYFLNWWDRHRERCAQCQRDGLFSQCAEYRANKAVCDRWAGLA